MAVTKLTDQEAIDNRPFLKPVFYYIFLSNANVIRFDERYIFTLYLFILNPKKPISS